MTDGLHTPPAVQHIPLLRAFAQLISIIFHPVFIPVYVTACLLFYHPLLFAGFDETSKYRLLATVAVNLTLLPAVTVFLCWRLKFVSSLQMATQKERIIPLAAAMIFYFWCWYVLRNLSAVPELFRQFLLGGFIAIIGGWLANIYFKVSLHGLAMGGMVAFMAMVAFGPAGGGAAWLVAGILIAGMVCSARLVRHAHIPAEVYLGFAAGFLCQCIAYGIT